MNRTKLEKIINNSLENFLGLTKENGYKTEIFFDTENNSIDVSIRSLKNKKEMAYIWIDEDFIEEHKKDKDFEEIVGKELVKRLTNQLEMDIKNTQTDIEKLEKKTYKAMDWLNEDKKLKQVVEATSGYVLKRDLADKVIENYVNKLSQDSNVKYKLKFEMNQSGGAWYIHAKPRESKNLEGNKLFTMIIDARILDNKPDNLEELIKNKLISELDRNLSIQNLKRTRKNPKDCVEVIDAILDAYKLVNQM